MKRASALVLVAVVLAGCGGKGKVAPVAAKKHPLSRQLTRLYRYDRSAPLAVRGRKEVRAEGVSLRDISFAGARGRRVLAFVVAPAKPGRYGAVIYMHGAGQSREEFLAEAYKLARRGGVSLLLDEPWVRSNLSGGGRALVNELVRNYVFNVIDVRRGVDLLLKRKDVDAKRIGFLGHSYGAAIGAIVSGVEPRVRVLDLLSGGGTPSRGYSLLTGGTPSEQRFFRRLLTVIDPVKYVGHAAPAQLFIQAGEHDELIPRPDLQSLISAASKPKRVKWYNAGHALTKAAFADSATWLAGELDLK